MKKILALLCLFTVIGATISAQGASSVTGTRICLLHAYEWDDESGSLITVREADPFYIGGWSVMVVSESGGVTVNGGITPHGVTQPLLIAGNVVTLPVNAEEPVATVTRSSTTEAGGVTTTVDSVMSYYVVNEGWWTNGAELADIQGEVLADGSIHIADGFAYYIETTVTTTITGKDGTTTTRVDETDDMSPVYRDLQLLVANGKHEFVNQADGTTSVVDVNIRQDGDTVWVTNLYGYGAPAVYMVLNEDEEMSFPSQMIRDIPDEMSPDGNGLWQNNALMGGVTPTAITWSLTTPTDGAQTWPGWNNNRLYFTDGTEFVIPGTDPVLRGDVNNDKMVNINDVTALVNALLSGQTTTPTQDYNPANADCNEDGGVNISDVTALINYLLSHTW